MGGKKVPDLAREREGGGQGDRADLADVPPCGILVEERRRGVSGDAVHGYLEESVRPSIVSEGTDGSAGPDRGSCVDSRDVKVAQCTTVPRDSSHRLRSAGARREMHVLGEGEGTQSTYAAKPAVNCGILGAVPQWEEPMDRVLRGEPRTIVDNGDLRLKWINIYAYGAGAVAEGGDCIGGVLEVFPVDDEWVVVHTRRDKAEYVATHDGVIGHLRHPE